VKTCIIFFPSFTGFTAVHHFHGIMMSAWIIILIVQPIFIASGKQSIHNFIGKTTYVIAPLVVVSLFLISKFNYLKSVSTLPPNVSIGTIALNIPATVAFILFYSLAIIYRHKTYHHMRFMIGTAVLLTGPGLVRILNTDF
jgi:hypothetical protein